MVNLVRFRRRGIPRRCRRRGGRLYCHFDPPSWLSEAPIQVLVSGVSGKPRATKAIWLRRRTFFPQATASQRLLRLGESGGEFRLVAGLKIQRRLLGETEAGPWQDYGSANLAEGELGEAQPLALR